MKIVVGALIAVCVLSSATTAEAQGRGNAYGKRNQSSSGSGTVPTPAAPTAPETFQSLPPGSGIRNFGAWLDDASVLPQGRGSLSVSFGYWKTSAYQEFDFPVADGAIGLTRRVQFGMSVPYYHANEPGGPVARGVGDLYFSTKIQLREPEKSGAVGFAVTPLLEVLSVAPAPDRRRVNWAVPANFEVQREGWRVFGSAGYFSRGALFASGALEIAVADRAWITGTISQSHSLERDDLSTALGIASRRTDASGGVGFSLSPNIAAFGVIGRTLSSRDPTAASVFLTGGVAFGFDAGRNITRTN